MLQEQDKFYSFQFFCTTDKYSEALRVLRKRNDVALSPDYIETTRDIFVDDRHVKTLKGVTLSGICFRGRLAKVLERLSQRRVTAFNDESRVRLGVLPRIERAGLNNYDLAEAQNLEYRFN